MNWTSNCLGKHAILRISLTSDFFQLSDLKGMLAGKQFNDNEEVFAEIEVFFLKQKSIPTTYMASKSLKNIIIGIPLSIGTMVNSISNTIN